MGSPRGAPRSGAIRRVGTSTTPVAHPSRRSLRDLLRMRSRDCVTLLLRRCYFIVIGEKCWNQFWACTKPVTLVDRARGATSGSRTGTARRRRSSRGPSSAPRPASSGEGRARLLQQRVHPCFLVVVAAEDARTMRKDRWRPRPARSKLHPFDKERDIQFRIVLILSHKPRT